MPLRDMMTTTASTTRAPAMASGKIGTPVSNLTNLLITPVMLSAMTGNHGIRQAIGLEGSAIQIFEAYTESHAHTDGGVSVTQMPDIESMDILVVGSVSYLVRFAEIQPATNNFGATLLLYLTEDKG
jgi:hypothetical protein